jgi:transketolase
VVDSLEAWGMKPTHDSIRGWFAAALHDEMEKNDKIWLLTGDLGYLMLDKIRDDFPDRFVNVGASEQLLIGTGVGLALSGKIPFCYSITTFLLFRAFEWHRNYLNHEKIPVRLVGSGMEDDYKHDGISHQPFLRELNLIFAAFPNIDTHMPKTKDEVPWMVTKMVTLNQPSFICLRR